MSDQLPFVVVQPSTPLGELFPPPHAVQPAAEALKAPSPEEARAVEAVFAQQEKESAAVSNLLGLYTSGMILHNLVTDSLTPSAEESKKLPRLKKEENSPE
jgi:hypothetical protein